MMNVTRLMVNLKKKQQEKFARLVENNPKLKGDNSSDLANIEYLLHLGCFLRVFKDLIILSTCCYFFGMIFKVVADLVCGEKDIHGQCMENSQT